MRKYFKSFRRADLPLYISSLLFLIIMYLWFSPNTLGLIQDNYGLTQYRSDLKDLAQLFYILVTLWLVLVTRKMAEISINSQKASSRPEILCELFISSEKPKIDFFSGIKNVEMRNTNDSTYDEGQAGANIFLILKSRYGGGKAINLKMDAKLEAHNPDAIILSRTIQVDYIAEGDCIAFYMFKFERPSIENCSLKLNKLKLEFTTPFNEASKDPVLVQNYNLNNKILATGNHIGAIKLVDGIRVNN